MIENKSWKMDNLNSENSEMNSKLNGCESLN